MLELTDSNSKRKESKEAQDEVKGKQADQVSLTKSR